MHLLVYVLASLLILACIFSRLLTNYFAGDLRTHGCYRCFHSWRRAEQHFTQSGTSFFGGGPLCEPCWKKLKTPKARLPYYRQLFADWQKEMEIAPEEWDLLEAAVMSEV
jgi:hypothetical protein